MKFAIDRIIDDIVVLENIETKITKEINISLLPENIKEGNIIVFENEEYKLDLTEEELRRKRIQEKFNKLRKKE